ncbi:MAG: hypothetical protein ACFCUO_13205 [Rhodospirillales bacterium]
MSTCSGPCRRLVLAAGLAVMAATACAYRDGADDPLSRKLNWFSYLNGDDIRAQCGPGMPARYRLVYNGVYFAPGNEQVRTYDVWAAGPAAEHRVVVRVIGPLRLDAVVIDDPIGTLFRDPRDLLAPGRGTIRQITVDDDDLTALDRSLAESGFFAPAPRGLRLRSEDFFWLGAVCVDGRFVFNAFRWPSAAFDGLTFPALLLAWDPTGIPINPPKRLTAFDVYGSATPDPGAMQSFSLTVGDNGLVGVHTLF